LGRPPPRHELRAQGLPRLGRPRAAAVRRAAPLPAGARAPARLPDRRAAGQPPPPRARAVALRVRALPARLLRPADGLLHRPLPPPAPAPLRRTRAADDPRRKHLPRL